MFAAELASTFYYDYGINCSAMAFSIYIIAMLLKDVDGAEMHARQIAA